MIKVFVSSVIDASADQVWALVRDFNDLPSWHPLVDRSSIEGGRPSDAVGCIRSCHLTDGRRIREQLLSLSDYDLSFSYAIIESGLDLENFVAELKLTPVTDGKLVYASFGTHGLVAVDFDGKIAWHRQVGPLDNYHGTAGSPILYKNTVILYQDHRGDSFVAAFDKLTGETAWWTQRATKTGWGTPIVLRANGRDELILSSQHEVNAYDPNNGNLLWIAPDNIYLKGFIQLGRGSCNPILELKVIVLLAAGLIIINKDRGLPTAHKGFDLFDVFQSGDGPLQRDHGVVLYISGIGVLGTGDNDDQLGKLSVREEFNRKLPK